MHLGGINARAVWALPGSDGAGVRFVDVERGWDLGHPDLPPQRIPSIGIPLLHGINDGGFDDHGAGVLGIICATDHAGGTNTIGGLGIAPRAEGCVSSWFMGYDDDWYEISNIPGAILAAAVALFALRPPGGVPPFGEVLLVETTVDQIDRRRHAPSAGRSQFRQLGSDRPGQAGGDYRGGGGRQRRQRRNIRRRRRRDGREPRLGCDSRECRGAAGQPAGRPIPAAALGAARKQGGLLRVGDGVATCRSAASGPLSEPYRDNFDGTSAATAIVAGAAIVLAGPGPRHGGRPGRPKGVSYAAGGAVSATGCALVHAGHGPSASHAQDPSIGRMPDLGALWQALVAGQL